MQLPEFTKRLNNTELLELLDLLIHISRCGRLTRRNEQFYNEETSTVAFLKILRAIADSKEKE